MKLSIASLALVGALALASTQKSSAQYYENSRPDVGPFFFIGVGGAFTEDGEITDLTGFGGGNSISYRAGAHLEFGGGYAFTHWLSMGLEMGWSANEVDDVAGFVHDDTFLYNAPILASITLQHRIPNTIITPFVRAGVGGALTIFDTDAFSNGAVTLFGEDDDFVFAWQLSAGVRFDLNEQMSISATYKYFATDDSQYTYEGFSSPDIKLGIEGVHTHIVSVAFNLRF